MEYSDLEEEQRIAFCQQRLGAWSGVMGGQVVTDVEDDRVELRTRVGDRATRIRVDFDTGWTDVETKLANTTGVLVLSWDADKQPTNAPDPEWDDGSEQRMFLAPGLYIEEYPEEAKAMWELVGRMPQPLVQEIIQAMPTRISYLKIDADHISLRFEPDFHELPPDVSAVQWVFAMCDRIARFFESGSDSVASKPKLYISGKAANIANMASCPHCNTVVDLSEGSFCYNCGAPMKPKV